MAQPSPTKSVESLAPLALKRRRTNQPVMVNALSRLKNART